MKRQDYMFTIGYQGGRAVVDRKNQQRYARLTPQALAEKALYKAALSAALWDKDVQVQEKVLDLYNKQAVKPVASLEVLKRALGLTTQPDSAARVLYI